ncbi:MAG: HslVU peptidase proteolytic subunit, partial [Lentihominibacter sp.]
TVVTGFAGSVADAFSLTEKFESKLDEHGGNLKRAAVALAQLWRSDKAMRNLEALMIVADKEDMLVLSGTGEVIEPDQPFVAIGSGGNYAYSAANALYNNTDLGAEEIVRKSLEIAASICVYTNDHISVEKL